MAPQPINQNERRAINRKVALNAVSAGLPVLIVSDDKRPLISSFQRLDTSISAGERAEIEAKAVREGKQAPAYIGSTCDPATVRALFKTYPDGLPAACGGPSGLIVVDVDSKRDGVAKIETWMSEHGHSLPEGTPVTVTQSGGRHYIFRDTERHGNAAGALAALGCDIRGVAGVFVLPGAIRSSGARYQSKDGTPGLLYAFASGEIPPLPDFFRAAIAQGGETSTRVADATTAALAERLRSADLPEALDAATFVDDDKAGDRSSFRLALANRLCRAGHSAESYLATLIECEYGGAFVHETKPGEGEFNLRNVARDWSQAEARHAEETAKAERISAKSASIFGDCTDTLQAATAAVAAAIERGEDPGAEIDRLKLAEASADDATAEGSAAALELVDAFALGLDLKAPLAVLQTTMLAIQSAPIEAKEYEPAHVAEARAEKAARGSALPWEDQETSATLMHSNRADPLVEGVLEAGAISVVYGGSNVGKSFVVAGLGYAIASGVPWHEHATTRGAIVYVGLEGRSAFRRRVAALRNDLAPHCAIPAIFATTQVDGLNLTGEGSEAARVVATVREVEAKGGLPVRLVVIDTLAAVTPGSDENSGRDMGAFVDEIKKIVAACSGVHVLVVHHSGKDQARGARGHSKLRAAVDTEIEITPGEIRVTKQRDLEFASAIGFRLEPVDLGVDDKGRPLRTAIARLSALVNGRLATNGAAFGAVNDNANDARARLTPDQRNIYDIFIDRIEAAGGEPVPPSVVVAEAVKLGFKADTVRKTLSKRLVIEGLIERIGENYRLPKRGDIEPQDD